MNKASVSNANEKKKKVNLTLKGFYGLFFFFTIAG